MKSKLFVGGLAYTTSQADLAKLFSEVGSVVQATLITDRASGQSKGFGFVEMATPAHAQEAISRLDGSQFDGRTLVVNEARERSAR